ncbi:MAG: SRPBCC family protein [Halobacteria archaeon]
MNRINVKSTPDGWRLLVSRKIDAPVKTVWNLLTDTKAWRKWGTSVVGVEADRRYIKEGMEGEVEILGSFWVPFEITSYEEYRWTWDVAKIPATGHRVNELRGERSKAVFEVPMHMSGYTPVCGRALKKIEELAVD